MTWAHVEISCVSSWVLGNFLALEMDPFLVVDLCKTSEVPFELLGLHFPILLFQQLVSVIITPLITPNNFWGFNKRSSQEK